VRARARRPPRRAGRRRRRRARARRARSARARCLRVSARWRFRATPRAACLRRSGRSSPSAAALLLLLLLHSGACQPPARSPRQRARRPRPSPLRLDPRQRQPQQGTADAGQPVLTQGAGQDAAGDGQLRAGDGPGKAAAGARGEAGGALQAAPGGGGDGVTAERGRRPRGGDEEREDGKLRQPLRRSARSRLRDGREAAAPPQRPEASTDAGPQVSTACTMMSVAKCVCHCGHVA